MPCCLKRPACGRLAPIVSAHASVPATLYGHWRSRLDCSSRGRLAGEGRHVERTWEPDSDRSGQERDIERVWLVEHHQLVGGEEDQEGGEEDLNGEGGGLRLQSETAGLPLSSGRR